MKKSLLFGGALLWGLCTFGQSTLVSWSFDDYTTGTSMLNADQFHANNSAAQFQFSGSIAHWLQNNAGRHYADNNDDKAVVLDSWGFVPSQEKGFIIPVNTSGSAGLKLSFSMFTPGGKPGPGMWQIHYKVGDGNWVGVSGATPNPMLGGTWYDYAYDLPEICQNQATLLIRVSAKPLGSFYMGVGGMPVSPISRVKIDNVAVTASVSTSLGDQLSQDDVVVYPVPVMDVLYVSLPANARGQKVEVFNLVGSIVYQQAISGSGKIEVDLQSLATGSYILKVITDAGSVIKKLQIK